MPASVLLTRPAPADPAPFRRQLGHVAFGRDISTFHRLRPRDVPVGHTRHADAPTWRGRSPAISSSSTARPSHSMSRSGQRTDRTPASRRPLYDRPAVAPPGRRPPHTIHRNRLAGEGQSFTQMVNPAEDIRRDLVKTQLRNDAAPLGAVAQRLGFSSLEHLLALVPPHLRHPRQRLPPACATTDPPSPIESPFGTQTPRARFFTRAGALNAVVRETSLCASTECTEARNGNGTRNTRPAAALSASSAASRRRTRGPRRRRATGPGSSSRAAGSSRATSTRSPPGSAFTARLAAPAVG